MRNRPVNLKHTVAAIGPLLLLTGMALADVPPPELFDKLRDAEPAEAKRIEGEMSRIWSRSGSASMDLLLKRGREAMEAGDNRLAIEHLTALTDHAPDFAEGFHTRARAYFRSDLYGPALADLERTLALNPQHYEAIFGFAVMVQEFGDLRRAAELYRRVLAIHPNHENAQTALSRLKRDGIGREL
jgi:tetratricopeptide (TPR) repeat protein